MAIPQALFCPEIFQLICEQCTKGTLATLARTKRDLTEPVLDVLWHEISSIGPLIRCMPADLWNEHETEDERVELVNAITLSLNDVSQEDRLYAGQSCQPTWIGLTSMQHESEKSDLLTTL